MNDEIVENHLKELENGKLYSFNESSKVPRICAGVYTIWKDRQLIYVGMSGRSLTAETITGHRNSKSVNASSLQRGLTHAKKKHSISP